MYFNPLSLLVVVFLVSAVQASIVSINLLDKDFYKEASEKASSESARAACDSSSCSEACHSVSDGPGACEADKCKCQTQHIAYSFAVFSPLEFIDRLKYTDDVGCNILECVLHCKKHHRVGVCIHGACVCV